VFSSNVPLILVLTGCVALLAGLFGGGIKTKDIELPTISRMPRIISGLVGILLIGGATWLYIRPSAPPTPDPTETPVPVPSATFTPLPDATSTTPAPEATSTPVSLASPTAINPDPTNPAGFLRYYFDLLTDNRNYSDAWRLLTKRYQKQFYSSNFLAYEGYWGAVKQVNLDNVKVTQLTATSVDAQVEMTLIMTNGQSQQLSAKYRLIYNSNARTWMLDTP
jgi:hypothetical protein